MYQALYRTERPEDFSGVIGQDHIVRILKNQIRKGTTSHAYLFCGTRGTGKTTVARILAKAVNCTGEGEKPCCTCPSCRAIREGNFMDMIEIDAASNNGVDNVRELKESVNYPPAVGRKKVYIIDEVHMLSPAAFNALLKTLEEPPESVMFILATTDPQRLPATILSRCLRLDFHRIPAKDLASRMGDICRSRGVEVTEEALQILAAAADGSARDGLSILDRCLAGSDKVLDAAQVIEYLGTAPTGFFVNLTDRIAAGDVAGALVLLDKVLSEGKDVKQLLGDWLAHYRSLLIAKYVKEPGEMLGVSSEKGMLLSEQARKLSLGDIKNGIVTVAKTVNDARYSTQARVLMELAIVTLAGMEPEAPPTKEAAPRPAAPAQTRPVERMPETQKREPAPKTEQVRKPEPVAPAPKAEAPEPKAKTPAPKAKAPEPESEVPEPEAEGSALSGADPAEFWDRMWDFIPGSGSINMLRDSAELTYVDDKVMEIRVDSDMMYMVAERDQAVLAGAAKEILGKAPKVILKKAPRSGGSQMSFMDLSEPEPRPAAAGAVDGPAVEEGDAGQDGPSSEAEAMAKTLEQLFNIKPEIEK